ncbi:redox-sensitive transcriptional activator SoxR [Actinomadura rayongensis]|uniref:Redox-sensitive transcriptional activator SoxR n=1 Tax=Actinomadura rayongensis TaxID=1429076 RepID=A0A6I4VYJ2_9ACTN|nr:redox-sensitive transcriptional activator SoxR [Actinomadura rayongensis]MXQ63037.1 redox-sensitive transcriptional activator SoxR [Actinomadura rayongensis]
MPDERPELSWTAKEMTISELGARSGVPTSTLRYYERAGLISSRRTSGNQRRYARDTLRRVAFVRVSQRVGIPLATIREALSLLPDERTPTREDWEVLSRRWHDQLDARIERLTRLRDNLTGCIGCGCLSIDLCSLANPHDSLGREGPGPRLLDPPEDKDGAD